jgi:tetratricopeptide (TPR) repeat protein
VKRRAIVRVLRLVALVACVGSCGPDAADREHLAAVRGDEDGSTFRERIEHLDRAIALAPERPRYRESRALLLIDQGNFTSAKADLDDAIALGDRPYLRFLRGLVQCQLDDCFVAIPDFDRAIAEQPYNAQFYRGRALALVAVDQPDRAFADAERLIELSPQVGTSYYARGMAHAALGRHEAAIWDFDQALLRTPELVYPLRARARSHAALGDPDSADADRELADRRSREESACAYCLDPFRY